MDLSTKDAMQEMQQAIASGGGVVAQVGGLGQVDPHAVVTRVVERVGSGSFDWKVTINDPGVGEVFELDMNA